MAGGAITHFVAGVPVSDLDAGIDWYTRFFGREPDTRVGEDLAGQGIGHEPVETYSDGVRRVKVPDPDGNALAELPGP